MAYESLQEFVDQLDRQGELIKVTERVDPKLEITEITDRFSKLKDGGKAILFENTGTNFPVLINAMGSLKRMQMALNVEHLDRIGEEMETLFKSLTGPKEGFIDKLKLLPQLSKLNSWMPKKIDGKGACQEIILNEVDLYQLPVLTTWPKDGGPFITLPMVNTIDPDTHIRNVGMYRMQILDKQSTGMHWHKHKVGARHFQAYKNRGEKMPIAVTLGGDPAYTYSATAPLPDNVDEYMLAGFIRKKKVELVKCITNNIYVPKDVDFVIEGYVDPQEDWIWEGPFGDHTGFYSLADWYPKFHVTCITHRKNAIYPTTIVGIPPMEDAYIGKATERIFLTPIKMTMLPEILDMDLPYAGVAHNITIIKIDKTYAGQALKVMHSLWGAGQIMFNKIMVVVDKNVDIHNYNDVLDAINQHTNIQQDVIFTKGPVDVLDHASTKWSFGSKMGIDATQKFEEELEATKEEQNTTFSNIDIPNSNISLVEKAWLFVAVENTHFNFDQQIAEISAQINPSIKWIVFVDKHVEINNLFNITWTASNHIDPKRDCKIINHRIFIDGTKKTKEKDGFQRDWPNPVVMNQATIDTIDQKWEQLGLGSFLKSPSIQYRKQMIGEEAIAEKNSN
ncbi:MAG: menaquinone biosynthesis decarboxylase [Bacteroidales bacterium]|nr:menaquinone biosynthesis decarboxylase [Bacteroidales bacterium]